MCLTDARAFKFGWFGDMADASTRLDVAPVVLQNFYVLPCSRLFAVYFAVMYTRAFENNFVTIFNDFYFVIITFLNFKQLIPTRKCTVSLQFHLRLVSRYKIVSVIHFFNSFPMRYHRLPLLKNGVLKISLQLSSFTHRGIRLDTTLYNAERNSMGTPYSVISSSKDKQFPLTLI